MSSFPPSISDVKDSIEKTDDNGSFQIYSYSYCDNDTPSNVKECRGLIFDGDALLFKSLGFTPEYNESNRETLYQLPIENYTFFPAEEGTLIRLFYSSKESKWYISTHRKLNAFNSRWGAAKSFGDIFVDSIKNHGWTSLDHLTDHLDKNYMYLFFIRNTLENKIVSDPPSESTTSYFVGCMESGSNTLKSDVALDFPSQKPLLFQNWNEVFDYVNQVNPKDKQGVLAFYKDQDGSTKQLKIVNQKYQMYSQVRGNEPNLILRYLNIRSHPIYSKLIYDIYPEHLNKFINIENLIIKIAKNIHNAYISRFVNKNYVVVSQEEYRVIRECHGWHISNREKNKVTLSQVIRILNQDQYVSTLYTLINRC